MELFDLSGKVAVVTGSSRGIGRSIARKLSEAGAKIIVSSRNADACSEVAKEINADGGHAIHYACNVSDKVQVTNLVKESHSQMGGIDILVSNAAANPIFGSMLEMDDNSFDKIISTNVHGPIWLINLIVPEMKARGEGSIILISSIVELVGNRNIGPYAISKAATSQMARNYAVELGPFNVRVNSIAPGLVKTEFARALWEGEGGKLFSDKTPLNRLAEPEDISGVAVFLASDASKFVTGQTIVVDGGRMIAGEF